MNLTARSPLSAPANSEFPMTHVTYKIVEHDGGWAYTVDGVFSEPFPNAPRRWQRPGAQPPSSGCRVARR
jgi:hypothetical protein